MRLPTKPSAACAAALAALALGACGNKTVSIHGGETEGIYLNVGELKYQVQISRQLNPRAIPEDATFVGGVEPSEARLAPDELWFAVFVRIENETDRAVAPVPPEGFTIEDTEGNQYRPVTIQPSNPFRYVAAKVPRHGVVPNPNGVAAQNGSIGGLELLYKLKRGTLDNRPLEMTIRSTLPPDRATDVLDV